MVSYKSIPKAIWSIFGIIMLVGLFDTAVPASVFGNEIANMYCPVTTSEKANKKYFVDYKGQRIYFCCNDCKRDFLQNPEKYMSDYKRQMEKQGESGVLSDKNAPEQQKINPEIALNLQENQSHIEHNQAEDSTRAEASGALDTDAVSGSQATTEQDQPGNLGQNKSSAIEFIGKFHPIVIHFPIALVMVALLFAVISLLSKTPLYDIISIRCVYLAFLSAIIAVLFGLAAGAGATYPKFLLTYFRWHRFMGISSAVLLGITSAFAYKYDRKKNKRNAWFFRSILFLNALFIGITGHLGATLVYGPHYFDL